VDGVLSGGANNGQSTAAPCFLLDSEHVQLSNGSCDVRIEAIAEDVQAAIDLGARLCALASGTFTWCDARMLAATATGIPFAAVRNILILRGIHCELTFGREAD
jgi:hypothetical protein